MQQQQFTLRKAKGDGRVYAAHFPWDKPGTAHFHEDAVLTRVDDDLSAGQTGDARLKVMPWVLEEGEYRFKGERKDPPSVMAALIPENSEFKLVILDGWYNFSVSSDRRILTLEEAEEEMSKKLSQRKNSKWMMRNLQAGETEEDGGIADDGDDELQLGGAGDDGDSEDGEIDFDNVFSDDEDTVPVVQNVEESDEDEDGAKDASKYREDISAKLLDHLENEADGGGSLFDDDGDDDFTAADMGEARWSKPGDGGSGVGEGADGADGAPAATTTTSTSSRGSSGSSSRKGKAAAGSAEAGSGSSSKKRKTRDTDEAAGEPDAKRQKTGSSVTEADLLAVLRARPVTTGKKLNKDLKARLGGSVPAKELVAIVKKFCVHDKATKTITLKDEFR